MGTVTGRFSSQYPNLQQVPARDPELGPMIRSLFIPEEDSEWYCADYSQQEPRVLIHYACLKDMNSALQVQKEFCRYLFCCIVNLDSIVASNSEQRSFTVN